MLPQQLAAYSKLAFQEIVQPRILWSASSFAVQGAFKHAISICSSLGQLYQVFSDHLNWLQACQ